MMKERDDMSGNGDVDARSDRGDAGEAFRPLDDDRLLAYALGLENDPELERAAAEDPTLAARLDALRGDLEVVSATLDRVVPAPPDEYTDLRDERWDGLRPFMAAPAPRRRRTWLRVLAPVAVVALVLVAGVITIPRLGDGVGQEMTVGDTDKAADVAAPREGAEPSEATGGGAGAAFSLRVPDADAYRTIVVARAGSPAAEAQRFTVLRVLRGEAGEYLRLKVIDRAAAPFTVHILYLDPVGVVEGSGASPATPAPSSAASGRVLEFEYKGAPAVARQLPGDVAPETITLP